tara:strand:+ start:202 stop:870 length:669 start_codon:yes stop_codon:yes gene_type:complete
MKKKKIKPHKPLTDAEAKKIIGGSVEYWGTAEDAAPSPKNLSNGISLAPVDKDGNDIEWVGYGWPGIVKYAEALGVNYTVIGDWLENTYGNKATFNQIMFAQEVHKSLGMVDYYRRPRENMAPTGKESDMHYAIRMQQPKIFKLYAAAGGKAQDKFKGITALYKQIYKTRKKYVEAYLYEHQHTKAEKQKMAEAASKALGTDKIFEKIEEASQELIKKKKKK